MDDYEDLYEVDYKCPKCGGAMEYFCFDENVDEYNFNGGVIVCEDCGFEMPEEAYGFSSREEYESWFDEAYERIYTYEDDD